MKKTSAKARRQRDDRAYAEFEAVMRKLAKTTRAPAAPQGEERMAAPERQSASPGDR